MTVHPELNAERNAYFGDLHVHTTYSFDAFTFGSVDTPHYAYRYTLRKPIKHSGGFDIQLRKPLNFYVITNHALFSGVANETANTSKLKPPR